MPQTPMNASGAGVLSGRRKPPGCARTAAQRTDAASGHDTGGLFRLCLALLTLCAGCGTAPQSLVLALGSASLRAEIAATPEQRRRGLMGRRKLAPQDGMLFVWPKAERHCMWMLHTHLPLSVAFLAADGRVLNIERMQPESTATYCASGAAQYALEVNAGWFAEHGIREGVRTAGLGNAPRGR
jgi:hypothetical protein